MLLSSRSYIMQEYVKIRNYESYNKQYIPTNTYRGHFGTVSEMNSQIQWMGTHMYLYTLHFWLIYVSKWQLHIYGQVFNCQYLHQTVTVGILWNQHERHKCISPFRKSAVDTILVVQRCTKIMLFLFVKHISSTFQMHYYNSYK